MSFSLKPFPLGPVTACKKPLSIFFAGSFEAVEEERSSASPPPLSSLSKAQGCCTRPRHSAGPALPAPSQGVPKALSERVPKACS